MSVIKSKPGVSLPLWEANEEILHYNLNLRERKYGGFYYETSMSVSAATSPILTDYVPGELWGSPIYGFAQYEAKAGAGLFFDSVTTGDSAPINVFASPYILYGDPVYGFAAYGGAGSAPVSSISATSLAPIVATSADSGLYGDLIDYGFMTYGESTHLLSSASSVSTSAPVLTNVIEITTYGGFSYGYGVYAS